MASKIVKTNMLVNKVMLLGNLHMLNIEQPLVLTIAGQPIVIVG